MAALGVVFRTITSAIGVPPIQTCCVSRGLVGEWLLIIRYEDMVSDRNSAWLLIYRFMGLPAPPPGYLDHKALAKWRGDPRFRFRLDPATVMLA